MEELLNKIIDETSDKIVIAVIKHLQQMDLTITKEYPPIMTRKQLAEYLQLSIGWVDKNIASIPRITGIGGTRFLKSDIDKWLISNSIHPDEYYISTISSKVKSTYKVK